MTLLQSIPTATAENPGADAPIVSVLMCVRNAARYVGEAVDSILTQTLRELELIVVDDGSTDSTLQLLQQRAKRDDRLRVIAQRQIGAVPCRNLALRESRGEFIAIMDADDAALPHRLERQVAFLRDHPDHVAVGAWVLMIDAEGEPLRPWQTPTTHEGIEAEHLQGRGGTIIHPSVLIRGSVLRALGGYREQFDLAQDVDLFLRLAEVGRLSNLDEVLLKYRQHSVSEGYRKRKRQAALAAQAVRDAFERRGLPAPDALPTVERTATPAEHAEKWAWWALQSGNVRTARKHAWRSVRRGPFRLSAWRALACALRGR